MTKNTKPAATKPAKNVKATPAKRAAKPADANAEKLSAKTKAAKAAEGQVPEALPALPPKPPVAADKPARRWATGPKQNHSTVEGPCRIVWDLFDAELARVKTLDQMNRKSVIDAALAKGVNIDTAKTQYQRRRAAHLGK